MQTTPPSANEYLPFAIRWTRDDCTALEKAGVLSFHYELVDGVIIKKMGQNIPHASAISKAFLWLTGQFGSDMVLTQVSIYVAASDNTANKPEPDVVLFNHPYSEITTDQPRPADIRLIVEVANTTRDFDLGTKAALYARAGILEYWVLSVVERQLFVHLLNDSGIYERTAFSETEIVAIQSVSQASVRVFDLLPAP